MELYRNPNVKSEIEEINKELKTLCAKFRMRNNILTDAERINQHYNEAMRLEKESKTHNEPHKKRFM